MVRFNYQIYLAEKIISAQTEIVGGANDESMDKNKTDSDHVPPPPLMCRHSAGAASELRRQWCRVRQDDRFTQLSDQIIFLVLMSYLIPGLANCSYIVLIIFELTRPLEAKVFSVFVLVTHALLSYSAALP